MKLQYLRLKEPPHSPNLVARFLLEAYTKLGIERRNEHVRYVKMQYTPQESNLSQTTQRHKKWQYGNNNIDLLGLWLVEVILVQNKSVWENIPK